MRRTAVSLLVLVSVAACACRKTDPPAPTDASAPAPSVVKEALPRCRAEPRELAVPGDDVVVGDAVLLPDALVVGVVRREAGKRAAGVLRAPLDLASSSFVELGPALGDDPPPVPYLHGTEVVVGLYTRKKDAGDAGLPSGTTRELRLVHADGKPMGSVVQQADESTAFDVAWSGDGPPLVAWDEDAPIAIGQFLADRGTVKVQILGSSDKPKAIPPYATDAEQPRLLARGERGGSEKGYWLAWVARRGESEPDSGTFAPEGPGEHRDHRWIEVATLDAKGELVGPIRRVSPDKGRVVSFELARAGDELAVLVQDEAALGEGAGARILRYTVFPDRVDGADLVDGGVGRALADVVGGAGSPRLLAWTDPSERAHLLPLGQGLVPQASATVERALDRARVLAAGADAVFGVASEAGEGGGRVVLRKLVCK